MHTTSTPCSSVGTGPVPEIGTGLVELPSDLLLAVLELVDAL